MHDIVTLEEAGTAAVMVASTEFVEAAEAQSRALGTDPARVFVPHPIQDRTDSELRRLAEEAVDEVVRGLTDGG